MSGRCHLVKEFIFNPFVVQNIYLPPEHKAMGMPRAYLLRKLRDVSILQKHVNLELMGHYVTTDTGLHFTVSQ
jgi:hypothetical protein